MMNRELVTDPLGVDDLWTDLRATIDWLARQGVDEVLVMFGFSWGRHIYDKDWVDLPTRVDELERHVQEAERQNFGRLGRDNLYITIAPFDARLNYSYESDIHMSHGEDNAFVLAVRQRWQDNQWLTESQKSKHYNR